MKAKTQLLIALAFIAFCSCNASNINSSIEDSHLTNLQGNWTNQNSNELEVVLSIHLNESKESIYIMGKQLFKKQVIQKKNQTLVTLNDQKGYTYYMLAQMDNKDFLRMSITTEEVENFMPVGQLGERVFRLQRKNELGKRTIVASKE